MGIVFVFIFFLALLLKSVIGCAFAFAFVFLVLYASFGVANFSNIMYSYFCVLGWFNRVFNHTLSARTHKNTNKITNLLGVVGCVGGVFFRGLVGIVVLS